jgi:hypothetical protein
VAVIGGSLGVICGIYFGSVARCGETEEEDEEEEKSGVDCEGVPYMFSYRLNVFLLVLSALPPSDN